MIRAVLMVVMILGLTHTVRAADAINLYAAGSLKEALTEVAQAFGAKSGAVVELQFGPSGLLRERIEKGAPAHIFASADMGHPQKLQAEGKGGAVKLFARNQLCAMVRDGLSASPNNLLSVMLDPKVRIGTSTPKADPSGDYAYALFARAEQVSAGAKATLEAKALQLVGGPTSAAVPPGRNAYAWHLAEGRADVFLGYCTAAVPARSELPTLNVVQIPPELAVGADFGLIVLNNAPAGATALADFIVGNDGQAILAKHGFGGRQ